MFDCDVLVVGIEPVHPARQGGQLRTLGLLTGLAAHFRVAFAAPNVGPAIPAVAQQHGLCPPSQQLGLGRRLKATLSLHPKIAQLNFGKSGSSSLAALTKEVGPRAVLFAHSYLAQYLRGDHIVVVDFANIEVQRLRSLASLDRLHNRGSALVESLKARVWEPRVARSADLCLASNLLDLNVLETWGARTAYVPNALQNAENVVRSPEHGYVLFLASMDYAPNRNACRWLMDRCWPLVRAQLPNARLVIAGRASNKVFTSEPVAGIDVRGEVESTFQSIRDAAVVAAPVAHGGGTQLKVVEAAAALRVIVATTYSARSVPSGFMELCVVADSPEHFASSLVTMLSHPTDRWARECACEAASAALPDWAEAVHPIVRAIEE